MPISKFHGVIDEGQVRNEFWHWGDQKINSDWSQLALFRQAKLHLAQQLPTARQISQQLLRQALHALAQESSKGKQASEIIDRQFVQGQTVSEIVRDLKISSATINRIQHTGMKWVAEYLCEEEQRAHHRRTVALHQRLPAQTIDQLFGVTPHLEHLHCLFQPDSSHYIVLIEGGGGLGKTELANHFLRDEVIQSAYLDVAWVSAQEQIFCPAPGRTIPIPNSFTSAATIIEQLARQCLPQERAPIPFTLPRMIDALHGYFCVVPHLVVLDNLETVKDLPVLLAWVAKLANPTRFLLTGREKILETEIFYDVLSLPTLDRTAVLQLIYHEARRLGLDEIVQANACELEPIWQTVGGNPLALRLIVGQLIGHELATVLEDLRVIRSQSVKTMYDYLYGYAWERLDLSTQVVLMSLTQFGSEGGELATILPLLKEWDGLNLDDQTVCAALAQLVRLNLVAQNFSWHFPTRYTLHPLTRNFLLDQEPK